MQCQNFIWSVNVSLVSLSSTRAHSAADKIWKSDGGSAPPPQLHLWLRERGVGGYENACTHTRRTHALDTVDCNLRILVGVVQNLRE